jgi:hypothetical protein
MNITVEIKIIVFLKEYRAPPNNKLTHMSKPLSPRSPYVFIAYRPVRSLFVIYIKYYLYSCIRLVSERMHHSLQGAQTNARGQRMTDEMGEDGASAKLIA